MEREPATDSSAAGAQPRGFFYGWVVLGVAMGATVATSPGQTYLIGLFNEHLRESLGLDLERLSMAYLVATFAASLPMSLVGRLGDRVGVRAMTAFVSLGLAGACAVLANAAGFWSVTLAFFLLRMMGQGSLSLVASHTLAMWFERRLSLVEGLRQGSMSVAVVVLPSGIVWATSELGWRGTWWVFEAALAVFALIAWLLLRDRPEDVGQHLDNDTYQHDPAEPEAEPDVVAFTLREAMATKAFWILAITSFAMGLVGTACLFHSIPILKSFGVGDEAEKIAAMMVSAWGIALAIVLFGGGAIVDRVRPGLALSLAMATLAIGTASFLFVSVAGWIAVGGMFVLGAALGVFILASGPATARFFGRTHYGSIRGLETTLSVAGTSVGPYLFAKIASASGGGFEIPMIASAVVLAAVAAAAWTLEKPTPPVRG